MFPDDFNMAGEEGKRISVIRSNPMAAWCTAAFFKEFKLQKRIHLHPRSFFHNDEDTGDLGLNWTDVILAKVYTTVSLNYLLLNAAS
jgi:hypothetical protein